MISDFLIRVKVEGQQLVDKFKTSVDGVDKSVNKLNSSGSVGKLNGALKGLGDTFSSVASTGNNFADGLIGSFGRLGGAATAIGAVAAAVVGLGMKAIAIADQMQDLADATGLTSSEVMSFKNSVVAAGGDTDGFEKILAKLNQSTQEAAAGNEKMQKAFKDLGVYVRDANGEVRDTSDILKDIIQKYRDGEITATEYAASIDLMGKSINRLDLQKLNAINDPFTNDNIARLAEYQNQIDQLAASASEALVTAFGQVAGAINFAIGKLNEFISRYDQALAKQGLGRVGDSSLGSALTSTPATWAGRFIPLPKSKEQKRKEELDKQQADVDARLERMGLGKSSIQSLVNRGKLKGGDYGAVTSKPKKGGAGGGKSDAEREAEARAKALESAKQTTAELIYQNKESNDLRTKLLDTIGLDSDRAALIRANIQAESQGRRDVFALQQKINEESAKGKDANKGVIEELQKQITEKQAQVDKTKELNQLEYERTIQLGLQKNELQYQKELIDLMAEKNNQSLIAAEREKLIKGQISEKELGDKTKIIETESKHNATMKQFAADLEEATKRKDTVAIDGINKQMTIEQQRHDQAMANIKAEADYEKRKQASTRAGVRAAIESIKEQYSEYNVAQMSTMSLFNNMSDALDNFIDTGKFKFSDFARSIILDLAKIAAKAALSKIFTALGTAIFGGKAAGGPVIGGKPYVVGENGPELFVPNSNGSIMTNASLNKNAGQGQAMQPIVTNNYITNNINALDSRSVAQVFVENRKSLLGATTLARKELPYG